MMNHPVWNFACKLRVGERETAHSDLSHSEEETSRKNDDFGKK
jgi:hypothetical protein